MAIAEVTATLCIDSAVYWQWLVVSAVMTSKSILLATVPSFRFVHALRNYVYLKGAMCIESYDTYSDGWMDVCKGFTSSIFTRQPLLDRFFFHVFCGSCLQYTAKNMRRKTFPLLIHSFIHDPQMGKCVGCCGLLFSLLTSSINIMSGNNWL